MKLQNGDIVFYRDDKGIIFDCGLITLENDCPQVMRFRPFQGRVLETFHFTPGSPHYAIYRYIGRRDNAKGDNEIACDAVRWFKRWDRYRYSSHFWIFLSKLPIIRHWIKGNDDTAKASAEAGFISPTAIAWAFECAGVDLVPNKSPDVTSLDDLLHCPFLERVAK